MEIPSILTMVLIFIAFCTVATNGLKCWKTENKGYHYKEKEGPKLPDGTTPSTCEHNNCIFLLCAKQDVSAQKYIRVDAYWLCKEAGFCKRRGEGGHAENGMEGVEDYCKGEYNCLYCAECNNEDQCNKRYYPWLKDTTLNPLNRKLEPAPGTVCDKHDPNKNTTTKATTKTETIITNPEASTTVLLKTTKVINSTENGNSTTKTDQPTDKTVENGTSPADGIVTKTDDVYRFTGKFGGIRFGFGGGD